MYNYVWRRPYYDWLIKALGIWLDNKISDKLWVSEYLYKDNFFFLFDVLDLTVWFEEWYHAWPYHDQGHSTLSDPGAPGQLFYPNLIRCRWNEGSPTL